MRTRQYIEEALDSGKVSAVLTNGRVWKVRRNGKTKTWKTRPDEFRIPIKSGLKLHGYIDHTNLNDPSWVIDHG